MFEGVDVAEYTFHNLGSWERYIPDEFPEAAPAWAAFCRRLEDGQDWYAFAHPLDLQPGNVMATALPVTREDGVSGYMVQAVSRDPSRLFPAGCLLFGIKGVDPAEPKPWALFEGRRYDPEARTVEDWPLVRARQISAVSAKIQLSRTPYSESDLLTHTEALVKASGDRELQLWFDGAQTWKIENPNVQKLAKGFELTPATVQHLFDEADKITE